MKMRVSTPVRTSAPTRGSRDERSRRWFSLNHLNYGLMGLWAIAAAAATTFNIGLSELLERQAQTLFFELRGPIEPPENIVILTIDDESMAQGQFYRADPQQYADMEPIQAWPWQRTAYAIAIDKLLSAGAKAVALDVVLSAPSGSGPADDQVLEQVLQRYGNQVVLASQHAEEVTDQGLLNGWIEPLEQFRNQSVGIGVINMPLSPNGKIHQLGQYFLATLPPESLPQATGTPMPEMPLSFDKATLQAAQVSYPKPSGDSIFFYGPHKTFDHIPFWAVLDPKSGLQLEQRFKDKIVLIGSTVVSHQDFHETPFSKNWPHVEQLSGVEIQANAIATLMEGRAIADAIPQAPLKGLVVLLGIAGTGWLISRPKPPLPQLGTAAGIVLIWGIVGYATFVYGGLIIPTAVPIVAIVCSGLSQLTLGAVREQIRKKQLRDTLKHYAAIPIIQEIISQQDDLRDLLLEREAEIFGKILGNRYRVVKVLGTGGFSETYVAEDTQRPSNPPCVVKQLRLISDKPSMLKLMRRLFIVEAETLERLGQHSQIPQLLAYFEEDQEFYLVQELIIGRSLHSELLPRRPIPPVVVMDLMRDLLPVLDFIHREGVIHRDIKPVNIIRRSIDQKLVLIDFGIAKKISTQIAETDPHTKFTIGLGTQGYMPSEQAAGMPNFTSDLYALGITALEMLSGTPPHQFRRDDVGELHWPSSPLPMSTEFEQFLRKMVHHDYTQRYSSARDALKALEHIPEFAVEGVYTVERPKATSPSSETADFEAEELQELEDRLTDSLEAETQLWQDN